MTGKNFQYVKKKALYSTCVCFMISLFYACGLPMNNDLPGNISASQFHFSYDLKDTSIQQYLLPKNLKEISGLTYNPTDSTLFANHDEAGISYNITTTGKMVTNAKSGKPGDYEGIELVGDTLYMVKSNGQIYYQQKNKKFHKVKHSKHLNEANNVEGLGYLASEDKLLLACKGKSNNKKHLKEIYAYQISNKQMEKEPFLWVDKKSLNSFLKEKSVIFQNRAKKVAPSGIAVHPITNHIYILSFIGRTIFVLDINNNILHIEFLDGRLFRQPEGICFDPSGNLYIASEGGFNGLLTMVPIR